MSNDADDAFFDRAVAHIHLSNDQMTQSTRGQVSASMLYSAARLNAWVSACGFHTGPDMGAKKAETMKYFVDEFSKMLEENLDDYIANFDKYMKPSH